MTAKKFLQCIIKGIKSHQIQITPCYQQFFSCCFTPPSLPLRFQNVIEYSSQITQRLNQLEEESKDSGFAAKQKLAEVTALLFIYTVLSIPNGSKIPTAIIAALAKEYPEWEPHPIEFAKTVIFNELRCALLAIPEQTETTIKEALDKITQKILPALDKNDIKNLHQDFYQTALDLYAKDTRRRASVLFAPRDTDDPNGLEMKQLQMT